MNFAVQCAEKQLCTESQTAEDSVNDVGEQACFSVHGGESQRRVGEYGQPDIAPLSGR